MPVSNLIKTLFFLWILAEIATFIVIGNWLGVGWTLLLVIATSAAGLLLLREQGFRLLQSVAERLRAQQGNEAADMIEGSFIVLGGLLLIIPGFISDALGLLCFIPRLRRYLVRWLILAMSVPASKGKNRTIDHDD